MVVNMLVRLLHGVGFVHFAYRADVEASLISMIERACVLSGRRGMHVDTEDVPESFSFPVAPVEGDEPDAPAVQMHRRSDFHTIAATPELTHAGASQSNGLAERSVRTLEEPTGTMLAALQKHMKHPVTAEHPLLAWLLQHAAYVLNKHNFGTDGCTAL